MRWFFFGDFGIEERVDEQNFELFHRREREETMRAEGLMMWPSALSVAEDAVRQDVEWEVGLHNTWVVDSSNSCCNPRAPSSSSFHRPH